MFDVSKLIEIITLEELDHCLYRGQNIPTPWKRVFGGQVLGQALHAAYQTVPEDRFAHSLHGYFILGGDIDKPIIYQVETLRDGGSFTTRRVTASQNGKAIFVMACSFQLNQDGFEHQIEPKSVEGPEGLYTDQQLADMIKDFAPQLSQKIKDRHIDALEFRPVDPMSIGQMEAGKALRNVWLKLSEEKKLSLPLQHQLLAFASDYDLLITAFFPHRTEENANKIFLASLDHAMYFHRKFDFTKWLLYTTNSPSASNARGLGYGSIFDQEGQLVATVIQEGLIRVMSKKIEQSKSD